MSAWHLLWIIPLGLYLGVDLYLLIVLVLALRDWTPYQ